MAPFASMRKLLILLGMICISTSIASTEITDRLIDIEKEIECLAKNIYFEARGEPFKGQLAVAHVTLNRVRSGKYPNDICDVVYQKHQFSWTRDVPKIKKPDLYDSIRQVAYDVIIGKTKDPTGGALSFHSRHIESNWNKRPVATIGNHIFYR